MVSTLLSSVSSTEWLNKNSLENKCVGVVAQSVEPLDPPKKQVLGDCAWVRVPPIPIKRCLFFKWVVSHHANGETVSFSYPSSILVVGPSGCGKTVFTEKLLVDNPELFERPPAQVHYCYGAWQDRFRGMQDQGVVFHEGIPDHEALVQWFPQGQGVLVLDDLMDEGSHDKRVLDLFTKHSHHQGVTVLYLCQDMFPVGRYAKSISRNAHYIVAFKNPRDQLGVRNVMLQSFPATWKDTLQTFHQATTRPYGYLMLDLHPASSDQQRLWSHLLKDEGWTRTYQKRV